MFFLMGCFGTLGFFVHLVFIINASQNNGIVILNYNSSGEMIFEIILFSSLFLFSLFVTAFLLFKKGDNQIENDKHKKETLKVIYS